MALNITRRDVEEAHRYARDAISRVREHQSTGERVTGQLVQTLEVAAGAFGVGVLSGRFGPLTVGGSQVPLDLALGVAGHLLGFAGLAGKYGEHLHNFSDGVLAGYLTKFGVGYGKAMAQKAGAATGQVWQGPGAVFGAELPAKASDRAREAQAGRRLTPPTASKPLSEAELAAMAQAVR